MGNFFVKFYENSIPKNLRYNFNINVLAMIFGGLFSGCYGAFYGVIAREQYHAGAFWIGLIFASMSIFGVLAFFVASFVPRGKENIYSKYIHIISSIFLILSPLSKTGPVFCIMLFMFHLTACYAPLENSVYGYIFPLNVRSKMLGYTKMFSSITSMLMTLIVGTVINLKFYHFPVWGIVFMLGGAFHACKGFCVGKYKLSGLVEGEVEKPFVFLKKSFLLIKEKFNIILIISGIIFTIGFNMFSTLYPMYQVDVLHINGKELSLITVAGSVGIILAYPILGTFFARKNPVKSWFCVFPLVIVYPLIYIFFGYHWFPLVIGSFLSSAFTVTNDLVWLNLIIYLGGNDKIKEYQAFYGLILGVRAILGLLVSTWIINYCEKMAFGIAMNYKICFWIGIGFILVSAIITLGILKEQRKN